MRILRALHTWQTRSVPTSAKGKTTDTDAINVTPNNVETFGDEVRVHISPGEACSDFDSPLFLVEDDVSETGHRDLDARGRGKTRVSGMPRTPDRERSAREAKVPKLQYPRSVVHQQNEGYIPRTIELRSATVPGRTEHADICELEFIQ